MPIVVAAPVRVFDADQLEGVAAGAGHVLAGPGVGADGQDPDEVGVDVDAAGAARP